MSTYDNHTWVIPEKVMIYQRNGSPKFQMRLKLPDRAGYVVRSTKQTVEEKAADVARHEYATLVYKVENNLDIQEYDFARLYKTWWDREKTSKSESRSKYIEGTVNRYFVGYFQEHLKKKSLTSLTDLDFEDYWAWRKNYWLSEQGASNLQRASRRRNNLANHRHSKKGNVAKVPSTKTLQMEQSLLKQIFWWAHRRGIIQRQPYIKAPKDANRKNLDVARRPTFNLEEYRILYTHMRAWVQGEKMGTQPRKNGRFGKTQTVVKRPHKLHIFQRELIRNYILFMANSGLRPNEARQLRWRDIRENADGTKYLYIRPTTKTGERDTYPLQHTYKYLERLKKQTEYYGPDDLVFGSRDGKPVENFGKTFKKILMDCGILEDDLGRERTIYSLRHFYATQRLLSKTKKMPMEVLAQNMGTSPKMVFEHYRHLSTHNYADVLTSR
ncbi:tyrosine-type recombinase/integrase [Paracoccaceae bacterium]|nr:tyrosine-type recombinase/integrase [Paracoccaceae bacterium]